MTTQGSRLEMLVELARGYRMSPAERREQRISLMMGLRGSRSTLTREKILELLGEAEDPPVGAKS